MNKKAIYSLLYSFLLILTFAQFLTTYITLRKTTSLNTKLAVDECNNDK